LPFVIPFILLIMTFSLYRTINRQKVLLESYRLQIDGTSIKREQSNTPVISIAYEEIREIVKNANGSFTIKGKSVLNAIGIPTQVDNYEQLEQLLSEIRPLTVKTTTPLLQKFQSLFSLLALGLLATFYIVKNKLAVGLSGTALLLLLGYSAYVIGKSKNVDNRTKIAALVMLLVFMSIAGGMYIKLTA
jgi:hypothetical protein